MRDSISNTARFSERESERSARDREPRALFLGMHGRSCGGESSQGLYFFNLIG